MRKLIYWFNLLETVRDQQEEILELKERVTALEEA